MANEEKLPWELTEEILSRVPPISLVRFTTVSKRWNALFNDKTFINNHKLTFRFILKTKSNIYSVSIDPKIEVRELTLDLPGLEESQIPKKVIDCDDFLLCRMDKEAAVVWNPWLNQTRWIKADVSEPRLQIEGIGYDGKNDSSSSSGRVVKNGYKSIWSYYNESYRLIWWKVHDFASNAWKDRKIGSSESEQARKRIWLHDSNGVTLNGTFYLAAYYEKSDPLYSLFDFDFSRVALYWFCYLPCRVNHYKDALVLRVFKGDRFSLLKQCHETKKIEIWVTKNKVNPKDGGGVVWVSLMTFSVPDLPGLVYLYTQPSYFLEEKRLVVCSCDEAGHAWIYVLGENKLMSKVKIVSVVDPWPLHCTYFPNLISVPPPCQGEDAESQV